MNCERRILAWAGLAVALGASSALGAQASEPSERPLLELSLEETVQRALENNVDIAVEQPVGVRRERKVDLRRKAGAHSREPGEVT